MLQSLPQTLGINAKQLSFSMLCVSNEIFQTIRAPVPEGTLKECIKQAEKLLNHFKNWLALRT